MAALKTIPDLAFDTPLVDIATGLITQQWARLLQSLFSESGTTTGSSSTITTTTLSAASTVITGPASFVAGDRLTVILVTDSTPGRQITWSSDFSTLTPVELNNGANKTTVFNFTAGADLKWYPNSNAFLQQD